MHSLKHLIIDQLQKRLIAESIYRIRKCLDLVNDEQIWQTPSDRILSIGISIVHLDGNVRQWLGSVCERNELPRDRAAEFKSNNTLERSKLLDLLNSLEETIRLRSKQLEHINLEDTLTIQGIPTNGLDAIVHVIEHFSYHTGQITLLTKWFSGQSTGYYSHLNLDE